MRSLVCIIIVDIEKWENDRSITCCVAPPFNLVITTDKFSTRRVGGQHISQQIYLKLLDIIMMS